MYLVFAAFTSRPTFLLVFTLVHWSIHNSIGSCCVTIFVVDVGRMWDLGSYEYFAIALLSIQPILKV
jgi:hypothetical protein